MDLEKIVEFVENKAKDILRKNDYIGSNKAIERESLELLQNIYFFRYGLKNELPPDWAEYAIERQEEIDKKEYAEYLRLKIKFDNQYVRNENG